MRRAILICAAGIAGLVAGCGSSGGAAYPAIKGSLKKTVEQLNRAADTRSCNAYATGLATTRRPRGISPGAAPAAAECKDIAPTLSGLGDVRYRKAKPFGTAALAEGPIPRQGRNSYALAFFVRDWDGRYRLDFGLIGTPQLKSKPPRGSAFADAAADAAAGFVRAVRAKDCKALLQYVIPGSLTNGAAGSPATCRSVFGGKNLAPQLAADPKAKPVKFGETRDFGFYGLATKENYYTLILATQPADQARAPGSPAVGVFDYQPNKRPL